MRRLAAETLEQRILLTTVSSVDPLANTHNAAVSTNVSATFDEAINAATATPQNFAVHSDMRAGTVAVSAAGMTVTADPSSDFFPGELVRVTATAGIQGTATANTSRAWQFRTEVTSGSGQFADGGTAFGSVSFNGIALGDVDGDGDLDAQLVATVDRREIWLNDGAGGFTNSGQNFSGAGISQFDDTRFADVDGDGDLDMIGSGRLLLNDGTGVFSAGPTVGENAVRAGDLDGDGDLDIMAGIRYAPNRVFFNDGSGQFTDSGQSVGNGPTDALGFGDFDNDGDLDVFEAHGGSQNQVLINDGSGVFSNSGQSLGGFRASRDVDVGDVDGDGDLDVIVGNDYIGGRFYQNDGSGVFTDTGQVIAGGLLWQFKLGDIDGDGDLDIIATNRNGPSEFWLNDGSGNFSDTGQGLIFGGDRAVYGSAIGDVDGDGDLDLVEANFRPNVGGRVWFNQNLTPNVTLGVDNSSIAEDAGTATVTATLSAAHTAPVTIDLTVSGSATATDDYTVSGTQIVIPIGSTTGAVTVTAVQDTVDDDDETVIVDISGATNAQEVGTQQVTITIIDDDDAIVVPDVTLSLDNAAIPEGGGVATFTATLSEVTTVAVTVDLGISGTAAASDFDASGTQIVVAPGATSGSITVTAVDDDVDEPDETVVVDIANVTGGTESGTQQQTTTITDDDEPVAPDVTLSVDNAEIAEAAGVATFAVTLSEVTTVPVTVELGITGTAAASDYTASGTQVAIAPGATTGSITITAVDDTEDESNETVTVDITAVTGGNEAGEQQQTTTITDDDDPPTLTVTTLTPTASGFTAEFSADLNTDVLNLYDTQTGGLGPADAVLQGAASGPIAGSLVIDPSLRSVTFIKSGDPLAADTYTVTLRSAADGFVDGGGQLLDGNDDGTEGDDYTSAFEVAAPAANSVTIGIPDVVRGPGQEVNLPADATGIPVTISEGTNVRAVDLRVAYDPTLMTITGGSVGADAPAGASVIVNSNTPGLAIVVYFSTNPLPAGAGTFVNLEASVPATDPSSIYGNQQVLDVHGVIVSDGNDNEAPTVVDDAVHLASFFADVSGNGRINAADASGVARFAALIDNGFAGGPNTDPLVVGDISGNGRLNAADASLLAQFAALIPVDQIPPIPGGIVITGTPNARPNDVQVLLPASSDLGSQSAFGDPPGTRADGAAIESGPTSFQVVDLFSTGDIEPALMNQLAVDRVMTQLAEDSIADDEDPLPGLEDASDELLTTIFNPDYS